MKKPTPEQIREMVKSEPFRWFMERLAYQMNYIDTVRNITKENLNEALARRMAIEIIENAFADLYEAGELEKLQKKIAREEDNILKKIKEYQDEY